MHPHPLCGFDAYSQILQLLSDPMLGFVADIDNVS